MPLKINLNASIAENIKMIKEYDGKAGISSPEESQAAKALILTMKPETTEDGVRIYQLRQDVDNYDAIGETGFLLHYARKAYRAVKNYFKSDNNIAQVKTNAAKSY